LGLSKIWGRSKLRSSKQTERRSHDLADLGNFRNRRCDRPHVVRLGRRKDKSKELGDKDTFLKLLVAQLKYQDPSNPADSTQFLAQTAQFTQVEKLGDIADLLKSQRLTGVSGLVGHNVTYMDENGAQQSGVISAAKLNGDSEPMLRIGNTDVQLSKVMEVLSTAPATGSTGPAAPKSDDPTRSPRRPVPRPPDPLPSRSQRNQVMLRSLYSGISGLHAHQQMMDVTGNNIANVNTVGYKASVVQFQDTLSQMLGAAGAPQNGQGGHQPGAGRPRREERRHPVQLEPGLPGDHRPGRRHDDPGRRLSSSPAAATRTSTPGPARSRSTRTASWSPRPATRCRAGPRATARSTRPASRVTSPCRWAPRSRPRGTSAITLKGNLSSDDVPDPLNPTNSGTNYVTTIPVKVYDPQGSTHTVTATFHRTANDNTAGTSTWTVDFSKDDPDQPRHPDPGRHAADDVFRERQVDRRRRNPVTKLTGIGSAPDGPYDVDVTDVTSFSGLSDARVFDTDGQTAGALTSLSVHRLDTGQIIGVYSNGLKQVLGQIAMATFKNVNGLEKTGDSMYRSTVNSGYAQVGQPAAPAWARSSAAPWRCRTSTSPRSSPTWSSPSAASRPTPVSSPPPTRSSRSSSA
jgi:flagellar hook protein FlgE